MNSFPSSTQDITQALQKLLEHPKLTIDIETLGLALKDAEIASIAFAWDENNGVAFLVNKEILDLLRVFFEQYSGLKIFHNASFDIRNIIFRCFMKNPSDDEGLLHGLETMYSNTHDTKIIAYLATNSTVRKSYSLKDLAKPFLGQWGLKEIKNVSKADPKELLEYNLKDCFATWYVLNTYGPIMVQENQLDIYENLFLPSLKIITHMELIGLPMGKNQIIKTEQELLDIHSKWLNQLYSLPLIKQYNWQLQKQAFIKKNLLLKRKFIPLEDFKTKLNPNSGKQLQGLLYDSFGFEVIEKTAKGQPSTSADTLEKLLNQLIHKYQITEEELNES